MSRPTVTPPATLSASERARSDAVDRAMSLGPAGVPALLGMLTDPSWAVRRGVVSALGAIGDAAVAPLCKLLVEQRDDETRIAATVDALVASSGQVETAVEQHLVGGIPPVAADAAQILGRRGKSSSIPTLIALTRHEDDNVAVAAIEALGRVGGRAAVEALSEAVASGNFFRTFPAIDVLGRSGDPRAVVALANLLSDASYALEAARALGRTGEKGAVVPLAGLLSQRSISLVRFAASALLHLRSRYADRFGAPEPIDEAIRASTFVNPAVRELARAIAGADESEQIACCYVLGLLGSPEAIPVLTALLDFEPEVASAAAAALQKLGRASELEVLNALREANDERRILLLGRLRHASSASEVTACVRSPDAGVRAAACHALGRLGNRSVLPALFEALADRDLLVRQAAVAAIQSLGGSQAETLALEAARSPTPEVRAAAIGILSYFGFESAADVLLEAVDDPNTRVRDTALMGLTTLEDQRIEQRVVAAAQAPDPRLRAVAMRALGHLPAKPGSIARLTGGVHDADPWVRYFAVQSLGRLRHVASTQLLTALLQDEAGQVRVATVEALAALGSDAAVEALRQAAGADDPDLQRAALVGLSGRTAALPLLLSASRSEDPATRLVALSALASIPDPGVVDVLSRAARDADENVRTAAVGLLGGRQEPAATRALVTLVTDPSVDARALEALATPAAGRVEGLVEALQTANDEAALVFASTLARLGPGEPARALVGLLSSPHIPARKAAAPALAAVGSEEAIAALREAAQTDPDPEVRRICQLLVAQ